MTLTSVLRLGRAPRKLEEPRKTGYSYPPEKLNAESLAEVRDFFPGEALCYYYAMEGNIFRKNLTEA